MDTIKPKNQVLPFAYLAVYIGWGTTYLAIRVGVQSVGPATFLGLRFFIAALALFPLLVFPQVWQRRWEQVSSSQILHSSLQGVLLLVCGLLPTAYAEKTIPSNITAIIIGCVPLAFAIFDWLINGVAIRRSVLYGFIFGFVGIALLSFGSNTIGRSTGAFYLGLILVVFGCSTWSFASVLNRKLKPIPYPLMNVFVQYLVAGATLLVLAFSFENFNPSVLRGLDSNLWFSLGYISLVPSLLSYTAYLWLLDNEPSHRVSTYAFVNPMVAVIAGAVILNEQASPIIISSLFFVIIGTWFNFRQPTQKLKMKT